MWVLGFSSGNWPVQQHFDWLSHLTERQMSHVLKEWKPQCFCSIVIKIPGVPASELLPDWKHSNFAFLVSQNGLPIHCPWLSSYLCRVLFYSTHRSVKYNGLLPTTPTFNPYTGLRYRSLTPGSAFYINNSFVHITHFVFKWIIAYTKKYSLGTLSDSPKSLSLTSLFLA